MHWGVTGVTCFTNILFSIKWRLLTEKILTRIFTFAKNVNWPLYKHNIYDRDLFLFNGKIYIPIWPFSFLLVTKCFFLRGLISQYSNELYLCFLAIFFLSLLSILHEHNIKCISYSSLWQFNLLCVILQISSTNDCMPLILLTSLISPNFHHIPQEKINPLLYFFTERHSLYSMFQPTTKILSLRDNVLKCTSSTQICSQPNCNIGHHCLQRRQ